MNEYLTVLMPVFNGMPYLPKAVESILNQTYRNFKFIIIDDGSTDGTSDYLNGLYDERIMVLNQANKGMGAALNRGLALCDTEFLARMDADDISLPGRFKCQIEFLKNYRQIGLVGTQISYLGKKGQIRQAPMMPLVHEKIYDVLLHRNYAPLCHASIMCRTDLIKKIGGYKIKDVGIDWDLYLRMGEISKLANLKTVYHLVRFHENRATVKNFRLQRIHSFYSRYCAKCRTEGRPEVSFDRFIYERSKRPLFKKLAEELDNYALCQYSHSMIKILDNQLIRGYIRLAWATFCSPGRTFRRILRIIRRFKTP